MDKDRPITLRFDPETRRRLEEQASADERDVAQQARFYIRRGLEKAAREQVDD